MRRGEARRGEARRDKMMINARRGEEDTKGQTRRDETR